MLVFESFLNVFWAIFGAQNGALGLIVDHVGLNSVFISTPKIDKIVKKCRKVLMENITGNVKLKRYNSGPSQTSKSDVSSTRNARIILILEMSLKLHQNVSQILQNGPKSAKRPSWESKKVPKDDTE